MSNFKERKILLVEDEREIRTMLEDILRKNGFSQVYPAEDYTTAMKICSTIQPDIAILDVVLPDGDGFSLLSAIRKYSELPVLFLTALDEGEDRLLGLGLGADDYIVKPFLPRELVLRLTAVLKRVYAPLEAKQASKLQLGEVTIDLESATVQRDNRTLQLTAKEHALLIKLYENKGRIVTIDALCQFLWGEESYGYENTLMVHIRRVREKIEADPSKPKFLLTVRGLGYKLIAEEG
ncbi:response regulator transcription factor [Virgibacillus sp. NKC19-3]|uniref:response regulator transcription factor n=1 Tax=Virgibacillus saliphilus TaxID=2831674 RepID=UPI001C9B2021|nr:response regulator transcription factor [Virgibacillus sp. NKC19-3]MBY7142616.1 response regulator transcription factor [Virgibacillus sp. NKC19-3]